jgi:hypothetical protein
MARYQRTEEDTKAIEEWLAKGNKITVCKQYERTANEDMKYTWGRRKKKVEPITKEVDKKD